MASNKKLLFQTILAVGALVLQVGAITTSEWSMKTQSTGKMHWGLWKGCSPGSLGCGHMPPDQNSKFPKNSLYAAQAFAIMGVLFVAMALFFMYLYKPLKKWANLCFLAGGVCSLIAVVIWYAELLKWPGLVGGKDIEAAPGYSFYLFLSGAMLSLVNGAAGYYG